MMKNFAALLAGAFTLSHAAGAAPPPPAKPMFLTLAPSPAQPSRPGRPPGNLTQWSGGFTDLKSNSVTYIMAGADPAISNTTTRITVWIIPVDMRYGPANGNMTFKPEVATWNGHTIIDDVKLSPLCDDGYDFSSGPTHLGQGQYLDEYQRGNFWQASVSAHRHYHTVLGCKTSRKLPPLKIKVKASDGSVIANPFGTGVVGTENVNLFDAQAKAYMTAHGAILTPDTLPLFVSYNIYLTQGGCCIGGYHSTVGGPPAGQTYAYSTFVDSPGAFAMDIDAISHETGEWMDDPFLANHVFCDDTSLLENGDPLGGLPAYGTFPVILNAITWHPQSLAYLPYFGAPPATSANSWYSFNNELTQACPGQAP